MTYEQQEKATPTMTTETTTEPISLHGIEAPERVTRYVRGVGTCYQEGARIMLRVDHDDQGTRVGTFRPSGEIIAGHWLDLTEAQSLQHVFAGMAPDFVGLGATYCIGSDRYPYTIVEVPNHKTVVVARDRRRAQRGHKGGEDQGYVYIPNADADRETFTLRKNGCWCPQGQGMRGAGHLLLGEREAYMDPCF